LPASLADFEFHHDADHQAQRLGKQSGAFQAEDGCRHLALGHPAKLGKCLPRRLGSPVKRRASPSGGVVGDVTAVLAADWEESNVS